MGCRGDRPIKNELDVGRFSWSDRLVVEQDDARAGFRRGMMKSDWEPLTDRLFLSWQDSNARVDAIGWRVQLGIERHVAASNRVFCYVRAGEIERAALARMRRLGLAVLRMKRAHARKQAGWAELDPVAEVDRARQHRSGRHDPDARQREDAIDRKPKPLACRAIAHRARRLFEMRTQRVYARAGQRRDRQDLGMRQRCRRDYGFCLPRQILDSLGGCELGLREDDDATIYAEQVEDRQMLKRLRHNPVIDGDCQKGKIDPACTCEHRVNEALVAWNIDEADRLPRSRGHIGEAQVNRDAAGFLILQPVASDARQRFDQSRLAVIDVTGEANNHGSASVDDRSSEGRRMRGSG